MAVTRLERKKLRKKIASKRRKTILKYLTAKPVSRKVVVPESTEKVSK